jgi:hypothetical protein
MSQRAESLIFRGTALVVLGFAELVWGCHAGISRRGRSRRQLQHDLSVVVGKVGVMIGLLGRTDSP